MFITDWICACVAGMTIDGREIKDQQVTDMAETYATSTYIARIWLEHVRGICPLNPKRFNAMLTVERFIGASDFQVLF